MGLVQFYVWVAREVLTRRFDRAQIVLIALGMIGGLRHLRYGSGSDLIWQLGASAVVVTICVRLLLGPYWLWLAEHMRAEAALGRSSGDTAARHGADLATGQSSLFNSRPLPPNYQQAKPAVVVADRAREPTPRD